MTFIDGLIGLIGAFSFLLSKKYLDKLLVYSVSFSIGALFGGAFFHFIPEAYAQLKLVKTLVYILIGFILFLILEKIIHWRHCHNAECKIHPFSYLLLYGNSVHNLIDGLIIAGSFLVSVPFGITSSLLVIIHEIPHEISNFGVLVYGGFKKGKALFYNFIIQLTAVLGGLIGYYFLSAKDYSLFLLPIAAGGFIYIAIEDLIPEVLKEKDFRKKLIHLAVALVGLMILISAKILAG